MNQTFDKILVAFDNSPASQVALQKACDIADRFKSSITALFVSNEKDSDFSNAKKFLEDFANSRNRELNIVERRGKVYSEVSKMEKDGGFALVVIGSHGKGGWVSNWIGSNAFKVISSSNCPVISVLETSVETKFDQILLPLADSVKTRQKVAYAVEIAAKFDSTIHLLAVSKSNGKNTISKVTSYLRQTERFLAERGVKYTSEEAFGVKVPEKCLEHAKTVNAGLMLIMTETESAGVFMDSYAQQLVNSSPIPVMSVHSRDLRLVGASGY